jgi:hypothetical protein
MSSVEVSVLWQYRDLKQIDEWEGTKLRPPWLRHGMYVLSLSPTLLCSNIQVKEFTAKTLKTKKITDNIVDEHSLLLYINFCAERPKRT